ncbi:hypothetical protein M407DRAFT_127998 [Tulasnella calospora MUT 4182]|uniref:Ca3427-like PBP 2 domain-containing protein n=1 Tax=Tulasnella calospora MUT 4182 TaxID=1051891 RepID=A0A0C3LK18_9AGAM|nr:hypothetical protein M407DRAFT_127998 [Tulasnella calospora MUT 4182]
MPPLRVGYVREHFASPLLQYTEDDGGKTFTLVNCPGGTGQIIKALEEDQVDVVIALTDALIAGIAKGKPYKLVGSYVSTPLNWAIVTGKESKYNSRADLKGTTFGISRFGSGSELMVKLMAHQEGWVKGEGKDLEDIDFKVCNNIDGLVQAVNDGSCSAFLWEWFTTKPWLDRGEVRFIGSVPTPWPSWMIAAHTSPERCPRDNVINFVATLTSYVNDFDSEASRKGKDVEFIKKQFGYPEEDIKAWLETVGYPTDCTKIDGSMLVRTFGILEATGAMVRPPSGFDPENFTNVEAVRVV